jgi:hypothetical protein
MRRLYLIHAEISEERPRRRKETADGGRQTAGEQAFQPVGEVDRQRMGERINEWRPRTADRGGAGFSLLGRQAVNE